MKIPDWLQPTLTSFETAKDPFMEVAINDAIRIAVNNHGEVSDDDRPVIQAEWSAFGFITRSDAESVWGTYFAPMFTATRGDGSEVRSPDIAGMNGYTVEHWEERAHSVKDPVMRARYSDLVWDLKKTITGQAPSYQFGQMAIDGYVEATESAAFHDGY